MFRLIRTLATGLFAFSTFSTFAANPVLLLIHGGPGNPLSPYADNRYG